MDIRTIKYTEVSFDKENSIMIPANETEKFEQPLKAMLVFETKGGKKEIPISVMSLAAMEKGKCKLVIHIDSK